MKMGKRTTWSPWKFTSVEEIQPLIQLISSRRLSAWVKEGLVRLPLRAPRTARMSPHREGGANVQCAWKARLAQDSAYVLPKDWDGSLGWVSLHGTWKTRTKLLYVGSTLIGVNNGRTSLPSPNQHRLRQNFSFVFMDFLWSYSVTLNKKSNIYVRRILQPLAHCPFKHNSTYICSPRI
jgi:hypothetical protein